MNFRFHVKRSFLAILLCTPLLHALHAEVEMFPLRARMLEHAVDDRAAADSTLHWTRLNEPGDFSRGFTNAAHWLRFAGTNQTPIEDWVLYIDNAMLEDIQVVAQTGDGQREYKAGALMGTADRLLEHRSFVFPVRLKPGEPYSISVRVRSRSALTVPMRLATHRVFDRWDRDQMALLGLFFGAAAIMTIYSAIVAMSIRDPAHGIYALALVLGGAFLLIQRGYAMLYLWPNGFPLLYELNLCFNGLSVLTITMFVYVFLNIRKELPRFRLLYFAAGLTGLFCATAAWFLDYTLVVRVVSGTTLVLTAASVTCSILLAARGRKHAVFFLLTSALLLPGILIFTLSNTGLVETPWPAGNALMAGFAAQMIIWPVVLSDRIRTLRTEQETARKAAEARSQFLAVMSHEIFTPMNAVLGLSTVLMNQQTDAESRRITSLIQKSTRGLLSVIHDILEFSRMEGGTMDLKASRFEPVKIVQEVADLMRPAAEARSIALSVSVEPGMPAFMGDAARIRQILLALIDNAVKFTNEGSVRITASPLTARAGLLLEVRDTGIGIPPEFKAQLYAPFRQADTGDSRRYGGIGLGLAIARRLTHMMHGEIHAEENLPRGTAFRIRLPLESLPPEATGIAEQAQTDGIQVLAADDDAIGRVVLEKLFAQIQCRAVVVDNGRAVIRAMDEGRFDIVFLDMQMPVMNGIETAIEIRKRFGGGIVLIALTANALPEHREACLKAGMNDFLTKPVDMTTLSAVITKHRAAVIA